MISRKCAEVADINRKRHDRGSLEFMEFPEGCECACQHMEPEEWEKMFSCPRPTSKETS